MFQIVTRRFRRSRTWRQPEPLSAPRRRRSAGPVCRLAAFTGLAASALLIPAVPAAADGSGRVDVAAVDEFVREGLTAASIPGAAIAITRGDQVLHVRGFGHDSNHVPVTESTLFRIASLSKSFTSLAVLQLVDAGKLPPP